MGRIGTMMNALRSLGAGFACLLSIALASEAAAQSARSMPATLFSKPDAERKLDAALADLTAKDLFSGVVLVAEGKRILFHRAYGLASREYGVPNAPETQFNLASASKMFTAVAVAKLAERGKLSYSDPIGKYIGADWIKDPRIRDRVTIEHLLTHTSGLGNYFTEDFRNSTRTRFVMMADYKPLVVDSTLAFEPGTSWLYSNAGFLLLGAVIESASGMSYDDFVRKEIFAPAGMTRTGPLNIEQVHQGYAQGYYRAGSLDGPPRTPAPGEKVEWRNNVFLHSVRGGPGGGMFSTAPDMLKFVNAFMSGKLVSPATVRLMTTPKPASPDYGYGMRLRDGGVGHSGGFPGISTSNVMYPDGYRTIILTNIDGGSSVAAARMAELAAQP